MGLKSLLFEREQEFREIFQTEKDWIYSHGDATDQDIIKMHLDAWIKSRIYGLSASMVMDYCLVDAIRLIDKVAEEFFNT